MKNNGKSEIKIHSIVKETEKAICVNVSVNWGEGNWRTNRINGGLKTGYNIWFD